MLPIDPPRGRTAIESFLLDELPALGPPPRGRQGLIRARRFFARLGDPQNVARPIHIVGTAGKGTAAGAIVARLVGAGASVGAHMSPHVYDLRERFLLNGTLPDWWQVDAAVADVWPAMVATEAAGDGTPSFFEVTLALAWIIGRNAAVDVQVTEAGIGGELDATNTIERTDKITIVMPIGYDHLEILGGDLSEIAGGKAEVIPPGGHVIIAPQPHPEARLVIEAVAKTRGALVHHVDPGVGSRPTWALQAEAVADRTTELLADSDLDLVLRADPIPLRLPGRFERVQMEGRTLILDGAHNPMKLRAVRDALGNQRANVLVTALSHEKVLETCAAELAGLADQIIATDFVVASGDRAVRRSWSARQLADAIGVARPGVSVVAVPGIESAMNAAIAATSEGDTIVATGSFMMLEPARAAVLRTPVAVHEP